MQHIYQLYFLKGLNSLWKTLKLFFKKAGNRLHILARFFLAWICMFGARKITELAVLDEGNRICRTWLLQFLFHYKICFSSLLLTFWEIPLRYSNGLILFLCGLIKTGQKQVRSSMRVFVNTLNIKTSVLLN